MSRSTVTTDTARPRRARVRWAPRAALVLLVAALAVAGAACDGGSPSRPADPGPSGISSDASSFFGDGPSATVESYVLAGPWASSEASGKAWGRLWLQRARNRQDRDGRGNDAYKWAIRTCDAVRLNGQAPGTMVRQVRDRGRFTAAGAKVIVTAALHALCPGHTPSSQPLP